LFFYSNNGAPFGLSRNDPYYLALYFKPIYNKRRWYIFKQDGFYRYCDLFESMHDIYYDYAMPQNWRAVTRDELRKFRKEVD